MSGPDGYGKENPIPVGLQYGLPLSSESDDVEIIDSLDNKKHICRFGTISRWFV